MSRIRQRGPHRGFARRSLALGVVLGTLAVVSGCQPQASGGGTVTPGGNGAVTDGPGPDGHDEGNNIGDLRARLQRLGVEHAAMSSNVDASFNVCEDLCSLASNICTVKEKLCDIADDHPGEDEYQDLCRKAELECGEAEDSCVSCVENRERHEEAASSNSP